jgi:hypothetical protein
LIHSATVCSAEPSSVKPDVSVSETEWSKISRTLDETSELTTADPDDWRTPLLRYLENPSYIVDRKVKCQSLNNGMLDNTLSPDYRWFIIKMLGFESI